MLNPFEATLICIIVMLIIIIVLLLVLHYFESRVNDNSTKLIALYENAISVLEMEVKNYKRIADNATTRMKDIIEINSGWKEEDFK